MELEIQAAIYQHGFVANLRKGISPTQEECTVEFEFYHDSELAAIAEIVVIPPMEDPNSLFDYADDIDVDQGIAVGTLIELFKRKVKSCATMDSILRIFVTCMSIHSGASAESAAGSLIISTI